ncbi:MAG: hypothetical protein ACT452_21355 [Microthrixaceae bacterium]
MRTDEQALELVRAKAAAIRRRRLVKLGSGGLVAVAFVVFGAAAAQPGDRTKVDFAADDDVATTTAEPSPAGPASSSTSAPDGARAARLRVEAVVLDPHPVLDHDLHLRVTVTDGDGSLTDLTALYRVDDPYLFDDSQEATPSTVRVIPSRSCGDPGPSSETIEVALPTDQHEVMRQRNPRTGTLEPTPVTIRVEVTATSRTGCGQAGASEDAGVHTDWFDLALGNGPILPSTPAFGSGPSWWIGIMESFDCDGVLRRVDVDWGDGTEIEALQPHVNSKGGFYGCRENQTQTYWFFPLEHDYANPGTYTITARSISTDDQGRNEQQSAVGTFEHTVPPPDDDGSGGDGGPVTVP